MIKYVGYLMLVVAFYAGYAYWPAPVILVLALISTLIFATARRASVRATDKGGPANAMLDGLFLFGLQCMIIFTAYGLGYIVVRSLS